MRGEIARGDRGAQRGCRNYTRSNCFDGALKLRRAVREEAGLMAGEEVDEGGEGDAAGTTQ
jgi:hypothetical protein